jgi:hypothetical protein
MNHQELSTILTPNGYAHAVIDGVLTINPSGYIYLGSLTHLPENTTFANGGSVDLSRLTHLPENTAFTNGGYVYLSRLTHLPENIAFTNGGHVYLDNLTHLPENTTFANDGYVKLSSLVGEQHSYRGQVITLRNVDGYTMLIESEKTIKGVTLCKARYFGGGDLDKLKPCYVATIGGNHAHGATAREAIQDAKDKAAINIDPSEVVAAIKSAGHVTLSQYRAITGACREGCRQFLASIGRPDVTGLSLDEAKTLVRGHYGYEKFIEALNNN